MWQGRGGGGLLHFLMREEGPLVTFFGACGVVDPVEDNKRQAANHEDDSHNEEDGRLKKEGDKKRIRCN